MVALKRFSFLAVIFTVLLAIPFSVYADTCEGYDYTRCPKGYAQSATCQNGKTKKYKCEICAKGYIKYNGRCIKQLKCKNGGTQEGTICKCPTGWTGNLCQTAAKCPYKATKCATGYYATGNTCKTGKKTVVECKANVCSGYEYTKCPSGYAQSATCQSGKTKKYKCEICAKGYIKYNGRCIKQLKCKNGGTQEGTICKCPTGWTGNLCQTAAKCPYKDTKCATGYYATGNTCKTGKKTVLECKANVCSGYEYTKCPTGSKASATCQSGKTKKYKCETCTKGYIFSGGKCVIKLNCQNGGTQNGSVCKCPAGWTGNLCQTKNSCPYNTTSCTTGYEETGDTCQSGGVTYKKCKAKECAGYDLSAVPTHCSKSQYCQKGSVKVYKCLACQTGWIGENCSEQTDITDEDNGTEIIKKRLEGKNLVGFDVEDGKGYLDANNANVKAVVDSISSVIGVDVSDVIFNSQDVYGGGNAISNNKDMKQTANIEITQKGNGDVYGIRNKSDTISLSYTDNDNDEDDEDEEDDDMNIYNAFGYNAVGTIKIVDTSGSNTTNNKDEYGHIYGIYSDAANIVVENAETMEDPQVDTYAQGTIDITSNSDKHIYGVYAYDEVVNAEGDDLGQAIAQINITNNGNGDVYGIKSFDEVYNTDASDNSIAEGYITIKNKGNGNVYGIVSSGEDNDVYNAFAGHNRGNPEDIKDSATGIGVVSIDNQGNGDVYGIKSELYVNNTKAWYDSNATGTVRLKNNGSGDAFGIYAEVIDSVDEYAEGSPIAKSIVNIINAGNGNAYGMSGNYIHNITKGSNITSTIEMANVNKGLAVGIYGKYGTIENSGTIKIHNLGTGTAVGIYADDSAYVINSGTISIDRANFVDNMATSDNVTYKASSETGGKAIGIYGATNSSIENSGTIKISGAETAYGIYSEGGNVTNIGTISIDGNTKHENAIVLNGGQLFQNGVLIANAEPTSASVSSAPITASLNLNDFGGTVVASETSQFIVEGGISGDLAINNSVIANGFDDTYTIADMINASDTSGLNLISQSALFDVKLENNTDAVMTMKSFNNVVDNSSVAAFLQNNYAYGNNENLFATLKSAETIAQLNSNINDLFGSDMLSRMSFEDLTMMRELNFDMNNQLFSQEEGYFALGGDISPSQYDGNLGSIGRYSLNGYNDGKRSFALGVAISDVYTDDDHSSDSRFDRSFVISSPYGYRMDNGFELITSPKIGYAHGTYDRTGFNGMTYEGKVEKNIYALMNEARYPVKFGSVMLMPKAEFNVIGYNIKGEENAREYSLKIKSQNHYSVEAGFGLNADKEFAPFKDTKIKLSGGVAVYHEFANPYELDVSMRGMSGSYKLRDEKRGDNRTVARFGFEYNLSDDVEISASLLSNIDHETRTDTSIDFKYNF